MRDNRWRASHIGRGRGTADQPSAQPCPYVLRQLVALTRLLGGGKGRDRKGQEVVGAHVLLSLLLFLVPLPLPPVPSPAACPWLQWAACTQQIAAVNALTFCHPALTPALDPTSTPTPGPLACCCTQRLARIRQPLLLRPSPSKPSLLPCCPCPCPCPHPCPCPCHPTTHPGLPASASCACLGASAP